MTTQMILQKSGRKNLAKVIKMMGMMMPIDYWEEAMD